MILMKLMGNISSFLWHSFAHVSFIILKFASQVLDIYLFIARPDLQPV